ncbi:hypothetical protein P4055_10800 [Pseudomonas aeruginosa]|nr:hypothetical protein [Pseudomonas aeruginosa]
MAGKVPLDGEITGKHVFTRQGLFIRITSEDGWTGIYQIGYDTLFHYAKWHCCC